MNDRKRFDKYKCCTVCTAEECFRLRFEMEFKQHEMVAVVLETYDINKDDVELIVYETRYELCKD